jgi:hypothetical protein
MLGASRTFFVVIASFKILSMHLPGRIEKNMLFVFYSAMLSLAQTVWHREENHEKAEST